MNKNELLDIVNALSERVNIANLDEIEVETDELRVKISKHTAPPQLPPPMAVPAAQPVIQQVVNSANTTEAAPAPSGNIVKSPIIGTFYASAAPGKPAYVKVGSRVEKGAVICIVESMKLMNEITSEFEGTVAEIYVLDGQAIEFDQPIMRIE